MPNTRVYVGLVSHTTREVFKADAEPTRDTHGHLYAAVVGPFRTARAARFLARYGAGNPHTFDVRSTERIARRAWNRGDRF